MKVIEVNTSELDHSFLVINAVVNKDNPNYIRPLDKEVLDTFDPSKNKLFKDGAAKRWIIQDETGKTLGRIAAFHYAKYKNKGTDFPTGCIGYFDAVDDQLVANLLFDTAKAWLISEGMEAMDGPVNLAIEISGGG